MSRRLLAVALAVVVGSVHAQPVYDGALADVIDQVERQTTWRFLYADALVAGARVRVRAEPDALPAALAQTLAPQGIGVETDAARRRILLVPASSEPGPTAAPSRPPARVVRGRVLDRETGEALPYATVTWDGGRRGVVTDASGGFVLSPGDGVVPLTASFVGYRAQTAAPRGQAVTFRLAPDPVAQADVVIDARALVAPLDTAWASRIALGRYGAIAEGGGLRALEALPAVAPAPLFSEGLIVRGSPSDAFEVRLDGVPIYNPRHLFGLVDAFNGDALRAVALHVGVAPAEVAVAPGGAVEYVTATGSPRRPSVQAGVSSFAARASAAAPLRPGRTSVLAGGRAALLDAVPWSPALVEQGLGVVRRTSTLPAGTAEVSEQILRVESTGASFWDLHAALADERVGGRTVVTGYLGGDETALTAQRYVRVPASEDPDRLALFPVATRNQWGSGAAGLLDQRLLSPRVALSSRIGGSVYAARFARDDFTFTFARDVRNPLLLPVDTLGYDNRLAEGVLAQRLDVAAGRGVASAGYRLHRYRQRYEEQAASRLSFEDEHGATRLDLHGAWSGHVGAGVDLDAGLRGHLFSASRPRLSPRVRVRAGLGRGLAVSLAAGRSVQFVHRLTLGDVVGAAAWVLSESTETVTEADLVEATVDAVAGPMSLQLTGYRKRTRGQWLHAEASATRGVPVTTILTRPWLTGVGADARGLEAMGRVPVGPWSLGLSGALARVDLDHPDLNGGLPFPAEWDRRLRATALVDGPLVRGVRVAMSWTVASGPPNPLAAADGEADRLPGLSQLDLRLDAQRQVAAVRVRLTVAVRNALGRDNVVTREVSSLVRRRATGGLQFGAVPLDVYDAGRLPTVDLSLAW